MQIVMTSKEFTEKLIHIATEIKTEYKNWFPYNLGYYNYNHKFSWDCWNLIKSLIWGWTETKKVGYYAKPNLKTGLGDWDGETILRHCSGVTSNFSSLTAGEYLVNAGISHAGTYIGEFTYKNKVYNVVECTPAFGGGVVLSYVDAKGGRYSCKGGYRNGGWSQHGKLPWINYTGVKPVTPTKEGETVTYRSYDLYLRKWLPPVTSGKAVADTAGITGDAMGALAVKVSKGAVSYRVHDEDSGWLPVVRGYDIKDSEKGFAGDYMAIDAIAINSKTVKLAYRVKLRKSQKWLEWVKSTDYNLKDHEKGYAGIIGEMIDEIEIKVI